MKINYIMLIAGLLLVNGCNSTSTEDGGVAVAPAVTPEPTNNPLEPSATPEPSPSPEPTEAPIGTVEPQEKSTLTKVGWYMRTTIRTELSNGKVLKHDSAGVFGELADASAKKDRYDVESYGKAIFQVRLVNENLDKQKEYFSDYRFYNGSEKKESWTFVVKNEIGDDLSNSDFTISVAPTTNVYKKEMNDSKFIERRASEDKRSNLTLIDLDDQQEYTYEALASTTFNMEGKHARSFRWVLGEIDNTDRQPLLKINRKYIKATAAANSSSKFGMPPE